MFLGEYKTTFSGRGRVILPKKIRLGLSGERIFLCKGFEECLLGYTKAGFEELSREPLQGEMTDERSRNLRRYLFSGSEEVELDKQGRFVISTSLLDFAKLKSVVVIIGAGDHFEVWSEKNWNIKRRELEEGYAKVP